MNDNTTTATNIIYASAGCSTIFDGVFTTSIPLSSQTKKVKKLNEIQKKELSADIQTLLEAGFIENDLTISSDGRNAIIELLFELHKAALVEFAKKYIEKNKYK